MKDYEPGNFGGGSDPQFTAELWEFLNTAEIVEAMKLASDLGNPAVEAIGDRLLKRFGEKMNVDRNRQLVGHMTKQVMERVGYEVVASNVKVTKIPFTRATRYQARDNFEFFVFRASGDLREICVAATRSTADFPPAPGDEWRFWTTVTTKLQAAVALGIQDIDAVREAIKTQGFFRHRVDRVFRTA